MGTRERHRQLALALFRSTATVLENPDLLAKVLGPRITSASATAAAVSKTWRQAVDAQGVDRFCNKRQSVEDFYFSSLYTPYRVHSEAVVADGSQQVRRRQRVRCPSRKG